MPHRLLTIASALSLLLCVATIVLWARSGYSEQIRFGNLHGNYHQFDTANGGVYWTKVANWGCDQPLRWVPTMDYFVPLPPRRHRKLTAIQRDGSKFILFQPSAFSSCVAASVETGTVIDISLTKAPPPFVNGAVMTPIGSPMPYRTYMIRYWLLSLAAGILPFSWLLWAIFVVQRAIAARGNLWARGFSPIIANPTKP